MLHEALDNRTPLLERVRFLGIFTSNLDEFFMKRARSLRRQATMGALDPTADGRTIAEVFAAVRAAVRGMLGEQAECYANLVHPLLAENSVHLLTWQQLDRRSGRR
ncbi:MAG: ppk1 [Phycisphaerales bacterium]|nr:ppk1 [Phycisphaerales bacterium]